MTDVPLELEFGDDDGDDDVYTAEDDDDGRPLPD